MRPDLEAQLRDYTDHIVERVNLDTFSTGNHLPAVDPPSTPRGVLVAAISAMAVIVLATPLLLSGVDPDMPVVDSLPDVHTWEWIRVDGTIDTLPSGQIFAGDGRFMALEEPCLPKEPSDCRPSQFWWSSPDGRAWTREPIDSELVDYELHPIDTGARTWIAGFRNDGSGSSALFRPVQEGWSQVDIGHQRFGHLPVIASKQDTVVVAFWSASGPKLAVSDDGGATFQSSRAPWFTTYFDVVANVDGFVAYVVDGLRQVDTWTSEDGWAWEQVETTAFVFSDPAHEVEVSGRPGGYMAVVSAGSETSYWRSRDALDWSRADISGGSIELTEFGLLRVATDPWTIREPFPWRFEFSTDGEDWHPLAIPPNTAITDDPARDAWSHADGRIFVTVDTWSGERIIWTGRFTDGG
jgi:hypothetical protein